MLACIRDREYVDACISLICPQGSRVLGLSSVVSTVTALGGSSLSALISRSSGTGTDPKLSGQS